MQKLDKGLGVFLLWPDMGVQSRLERANAKLLKNALKW